MPSRTSSSSSKTLRTEDRTDRQRAAEMLRIQEDRRDPGRAGDSGGRRSGDGPCLPQTDRRALDRGRTGRTRTRSNRPWRSRSTFREMQQRNGKPPRQRPASGFPRRGSTGWSTWWASWSRSRRAHPDRLRRCTARICAHRRGGGALTAELRDNTMSIRMLPIGTTFSKFKRLVRDLSAELGKEIELYHRGRRRPSSTRR